MAQGALRLGPNEDLGLGGSPGLSGQAQCRPMSPRLQKRETRERSEARG